MAGKQDRRTENLTPEETSILLGFAVQKRGSDGRITIVIRWWRLLATFVGLAIIGWLGLGGLLYTHFKYNRGFGEVSYVKMLTLLPFGLEAHRKEMGDYDVERGLEEARSGNYSEGFQLLRMGVARSPGNLEGRRALSEFYETALNAPDLAAAHLKEGLELGGIDDLDYLKRTLRILLSEQMGKDVQAIAEEYLPDEPDPTNRNRTLAFAAANADYLRGNYDRADARLMDYGLTDFLEGALLAAQISWDRGDRVASIKQLETFLENFPSSELLAQLSRFNRELGNYDEALKYALLHMSSNPLIVAPRIELLYVYNRMEDKERERGEAESILRQFREDESALQSLSSFAAETGNIRLARLAYEKALESQFRIADFALLLIEAHLVEEDYLGALDLAEELLQERPDWLQSRWATFNGLRSVASYGADRRDLGAIYLQDFIDESTAYTQAYLAVSNRLTAIEHHEQARKVLMAAYQHAPTNQRIVSDLIRSELKLGNTENLNQLLSRLLQMGRPDIDLLFEAYQKLGSDRFIFVPARESLLSELSVMLRGSGRSLQLLDG